MLNRDYKIFREGCYYHVYNRGNGRSTIYHDSSDYEQFLKRCKLVLGMRTSAPLDARGRSLRIQSFEKDTFSVLAYCLMPNHFHFLIRQNTEISVDRFVTKLCTSYAAYYNKKYNHVGHIFQDAFKAKLVDSDEYVTYLSAYVHNNPTNALEYPYSSFPDYVGDRAGTLCDKATVLAYFNDSAGDYRNFVLGYNEQYEAKISHLLFDE
ncbi:MAG: transposase [Candidatus Doudnabacteria bacterium]|nr:transposase [Candidatus Doudnabacteria bacterium]